MAADAKLALLPKETAETPAARRDAPQKQPERPAAMSTAPEKANRAAGNCGSEPNSST